MEEPPEEPGACAPRPPDMVGHLHLQGMEESLKEKSREGVLDSPDSGLPPSPSPSPPFYSLAPGILDARAGGAGASSEAPGPGEARAVSTHLRAERGAVPAPTTPQGDGVLQEPAWVHPGIPPAKKVSQVTAMLPRWGSRRLGGGGPAWPLQISPWLPASPGSLIVSSKRTGGEDRLKFSKRLASQR